jgi:hypothetical protein
MALQSRGADDGSNLSPPHIKWTSSSNMIAGQQGHNNSLIPFLLNINVAFFSAGLPEGPKTIESVNVDLDLSRLLSKKSSLFHIKQTGSR